jgi:hypothetical protein
MTWFQTGPVTKGDPYKVACVFEKSAFDPRPSDKPWATPGLSCSVWGIRYSNTHTALNYVGPLLARRRCSLATRVLAPGAKPGPDSQDRDFDSGLPGLSCQGKGSGIRCTITLNTVAGKRVLTSANGGTHWALGQRVPV